MMVIHGEDQIKSREYFLELKAQKPGDIIDGDSLTLSNLKSRLEAVSLFGETQNIYIENLFSRRPSNEKKAIIELLETKNPGNLVLWERKAVVTNLENKKFDLPKYLFAFWNNPTVKNLHLALKASAIEQIFAGLVTKAHNARNREWITSLLAIDYKQKTGNSPMGLVSALEVWLAKL